MRRTQTTSSVRARRRAAGPCYVASTAHIVWPSTRSAPQRRAIACTILMPSPPGRCRARRGAPSPACREVEPASVRHLSDTAILSPSGTTSATSSISFSAWWVARRSAVVASSLATSRASSRTGSIASSPVARRGRRGAERSQRERRRKISVDLRDIDPGLPIPRMVTPPMSYGCGSVRGDEREVIDHPADCEKSLHLG